MANTFIIPGCEFRHLDTGTNRESGRAWYRLRFEDSDGSNFSCFVPNDYAGPFLALQKGTMIDLVCELGYRSGNAAINIVGYQLPVSSDDLQDF